MDKFVAFCKKNKIDNSLLSGCIGMTCFKTVSKGQTSFLT